MHLVIPSCSGFVGCLLDSLAWWFRDICKCCVERKDYGRENDLLRGSVDGKDVVFDMSDWPYARVSHTLCWKRQWSPLCVPFPNVRPLPPLTHRQWELPSDLRWSGRDSNTIVYVSRINNDRKILSARRQAVYSILEANCSILADTCTRSRHQLWEDACRSLAVLHVAGSYPGSLDRTVIECAALGVPVITNLIHVWPTALPLHPYRHYVPVTEGAEGFAYAVQWLVQYRYCAVSLSTQLRQWYQASTDPQRCIDMLLSTDPILL